MRTIEISTQLDAPADVIWAAMKTPDALVHVAGSMLRYRAAERLDRPWRVDDAIVGWTFLGRVVPFSRHHLTVKLIDDEARVLVTEEHGGAVRRWDHVLITSPVDARRSTYQDRITIDAGALTPAVALFAQVFYRYRQRRWRRLAPVLDVSRRVEFTR